MTEVYLTNPYLRYIKTKVKDLRKIKGRYAISLEENIFYPGGGGQLPDKGFINLEDSPKYQVARILRADKKVFLILSEDIDFSINDLVDAEIDWIRRFSYMRCHTATHVFMGAVKRNLLDYDPDCINIPEGGNMFTIRFKSNWINTLEMGNMLIESSNQVICVNKKVIAKNYKMLSEATKEYRELYRGPGPKRFSGDVRLVIIDGWDANPCAGPHVNTLGEIGELCLKSIGDREISISLKK
jgi:alanyl-tRNA synthetase